MTLAEIARQSRDIQTAENEDQIVDDLEAPRSPDRPLPLYFSSNLIMTPPASIDSHEAKLISLRSFHVFKHRKRKDSSRHSRLKNCTSKPGLVDLLPPVLLLSGVLFACL